MKGVLKKIGNLFAREEKKNVPRAEAELRKSKEESLKYIEKHFGRAITRLSER